MVKIFVGQLPALFVKWLVVSNWNKFLTFEMGFTFFIAIYPLENKTDSISTTLQKLLQITTYKQTNTRNQLICSYLAEWFHNVTCHLSSLSWWCREQHTSKPCTTTKTQTVWWFLDTSLPFPSIFLHQIFASDILSSFLLRWFLTLSNRWSYGEEEGKQRVARFVIIYLILNWPFPADAGGKRWLTWCSIPKTWQYHCLPPVSAGNGQLQIWSIYSIRVQKTNSCKWADVVKLHKTIILPTHLHAAAWK